MRHTPGETLFNLREYSIFSGLTSLSGDFASEPGQLASGHVNVEMSEQFCGTIYRKCHGNYRILKNHLKGLKNLFKRFLFTFKGFNMWLLGTNLCMSSMSKISKFLSAIDGKKSFGTSFGSLHLEKRSFPIILWPFSTAWSSVHKLSLISSNTGRILGKPCWTAESCMLFVFSSRTSMLSLTSPHLE